MGIKKISIVGCGALGIMFASHMLKKLPHSQLQFIADRERITRYQNAEFYANGVRQAFNFVGPDVITQPSDLVIFAVKYNNLHDAIRIAKNHIDENTIILSFLNGISSEGIIGNTYNPEKIIYSMVAGMDATKAGYSVSFTKMGYVAFGSLGNNSLEDINKLSEFLDRVQIKYEIHEDIMKAIWWKFILNVGINQTSALLKSTYGMFQTSGYAENIMRMAMQEAYEISQRLSIGLNKQDLDNCVKIMKTLSPDGKTSMHQDIEAGRPTEVDMFAGSVIELGGKYNIPVPINTFLFNAIKALESRF